MQSVLHLGNSTCSSASQKQTTRRSTYMFLKQSSRDRLRHWTRCLGSSTEKIKLPPKEPTLAKFSFPSATHNVRDLLTSGESWTHCPITLHGHLHRKPRKLGKRTFAELRDTNGDIIQLHFASEWTGQEHMECIRRSGVEDALVVNGILRRKVNKNEDDSPEYELSVSEMQLLNNGGVDAAQLDSLKHSSPSTIPPKFRYLQLRTPFYQNALRTRSQASHVTRKVLIENHHFTEIETPALFKSTPEGAREFLVPTRSPDRFYALPQSPQQYKQMLMSSGFSRYFQIARCFRDEDLRADRQPEFTQVDLEMAYINNSKKVHAVIDDVIETVWREVAKKPVYKVDATGHIVPVKANRRRESDPAFNKLTYQEALSKYGIDKPDLRSALTIIDLSEYFKPLNEADHFGVVEACVLKQAFDPGNKYKVSHNLTDKEAYPRRRPIILPIQTEDEALNWWKPFVEKGILKTTDAFSQVKVLKALNLEHGDILAFATRAQLSYENPTPLGRFRQLAIEQFPGRWNRPLKPSNLEELTTEYDPKDIVVGSWVVDFPLFSPVDITESASEPFPKYDFKRWESTHHPFTMAKPEDYELLELNIAQVRGEHYDLVINGVEVGGGSRRIHDPELQKYVFEAILNIQNHDQLFGHLLKALSMGCPPHAGIALGFDRLCAMLVGTSSIRDVIAFPKNQSGSDPVVESPTSVSSAVLNEYYIDKLYL